MQQLCILHNTIQVSDASRMPEYSLSKKAEIAEIVLYRIARNFSREFILGN